MKNELHSPTREIGAETIERKKTARPEVVLPHTRSLAGHPTRRRHRNIHADEIDEPPDSMNRRRDS